LAETIFPLPSLPRQEHASDILLLLKSRSTAPALQIPALSIKTCQGLRNYNTHSTRNQANQQEKDHSLLKTPQAES